MAAIREVNFLRSNLCEMGYQQVLATAIVENNQSWIKLATNPVMHEKFKHFDKKYDFKQKIDDNSDQLVYCS